MPFEYTWRVYTMSTLRRMRSLNKFQRISIINSMSITKRQLEINNKILKTVSMYLEKYKLYLEINELKSKLNEDYKMLEGLVPYVPF